MNWLLLFYTHLCHIHYTIRCRKKIRPLFDLLLVIVAFIDLEILSVYRCNGNPPLSILNKSLNEIKKQQCNYYSPKHYVYLSNAFELCPSHIDS